ncbi:hypothetical protein SNOG_04555 [Parastagonospora nodorum SN15]|uniref:Uncharacterized protein n=1 Tax=Phaeosphaeria nodorum (strain SN15 / ATCC MYA-4574 / FGSC 10173) TaxID=321614 RepID=Q0UUK9_PHANO|nr:hypothetical protein SNOG_04555 [Parastagonospora nodorum SN15]EAT88315.2 hypothetical protein SNOG_04555 [Parastagonospora nodorum SN15]
MLGDELQASSSRKSVSSAHKPTSPKIETFELSEKEHPYIPVSTTKILGKFTRDPPPEHSNAELQKLRARVSQHSEIAEDVRKWAKNRESSTLFKVLLRAVFWNDVKVNMPAEQKLLNTIHHFFPPRADIKVVVCDFGDGRAQQQSVRLGDLEKALFFHTGSKVMGRPFVKAGRAGWPYLELEQFDLRSTRSIQDSRDILRILKSVPQVTSKIDAQVFDGDNNDNLVKDVTWRAQYVGKSFLLTMSPAAGVDYLNANMQHYLHTPPEELKEDNFASCVSHIYREFSETGTDTWRRKNAEWFLVYLVTELGTTPHNIRQGYSVPSLMDAYDAIVHELKERRYDRWQRNETINLVRAYLVCIDELTVLGEIFSKKLDFFRRLQKDCDHFEELDNDAGLPPDNDNGETTSERIGFAEHIMEESTATCKRLTADLRDSLNSLFQLRSIEQNELAIIADTQHKAIFVFTGFTIVFLPLSFFTSYFGMNLKGIIDTDKTQEYYWKVCGSVAFGIVLLEGFAV